MSARLGITGRSGLLGAILRPALSAVGDACGVQGSPDHLVADARQIPDTTTADEDDRVLLKVVPHTRNVARDLHAVSEPDAGDLAQSRVRLLGRGRVDPRADAPLLRRAAEGRRLGPC